MCHEQTDYAMGKNVQEDERGFAYFNNVQEFGNVVKYEEAELVYVK